MAKFTKHIMLSDEEKQFVIEYLRPFLEKDELNKIRVILDAKSSRQTEYKFPKIPDRGLYNYSPWTIRWWLLQELGEDIYFKDSQAIFQGEFFECPISEIVIPKNIKVIQDVAFNQSDLSRIRFDNGVEYIGNAVFAGAPFKSVTFPESLETLCLHVFAGCDNLTEVILSGRNKLKVYSSTFTGLLNGGKQYKLSIPKDKQIYIVDKQKYYDGSSSMNNEDFGDNVVIRY